jgi:hypothetical protein
VPVALRSVPRAREGKRSLRSPRHHVPARARRIAGESGFFTLIQSREAPDRAMGRGVVSAPPFPRRTLFLECCHSGTAGPT